uniref:nuclear transport factor 2 family protein n=1 Tax=Altererythrobacter segetis TaxID=1104773 RepID=UPI0014082504|nr:nuclear transport factor 2 family protein [Altererythrobacter segetis]
MDRARYERYLAAFNGKDYDTLGEFYADDVEFVLSEERGLKFHGRDAILNLYRPFHQAVDERVEIVRFADGGDFLAVEVNAEFRPIPGRQQSVIDLPPGKVLKVTTFAFYDLGPDDRFTRIRASSYSRRYEDT